MLKGQGWGWGAGLPELAPSLPSISTCTSIYNLLVSHEKLHGARLDPQHLQKLEMMWGGAALDLVIG